MALLNDEQLKQVEDAIEAAEKQTDAELVTVLASKSDNYYYIPTLWAALLALLVPALLRFTHFWLSADDLFLFQWIIFIVLALVFRLPVIMMRLVPKSIRYWRASNLARRQFLENNLHHTKGETGVLIFVSEAEHYVEIIADRGISAHVSNEQWQEIINNFIASIKQGKTQEGFISCIAACGTLLSQHAPHTGDKNELPNHLIVLD